MTERERERATIETGVHSRARALMRALEGKGTGSDRPFKGRTCPQPGAACQWSRPRAGLYPGPRSRHTPGFIAARRRPQHRAARQPSPCGGGREPRQPFPSQSKSAARVAGAGRKRRRRSRSAASTAASWRAPRRRPAPCARRGQRRPSRAPGSAGRPAARRRGCLSAGRRGLSRRQALELESRGGLW